MRLIDFTEEFQSTSTVFVGQICPNLESITNAVTNYQNIIGFLSMIN